MNVFLEKQFIRRWWLFMLILAVILIVVGTSYYASEGADDATSMTVSIISLLIAIPIVFALLFLRLDTRIDEKGIFTYFRPLGFTRKFFPWNEISDCYIRSYSPIKEYGGWGMRGLGSKSKAYNVAGNRGIQIVTTEGKKFLVGTQEPKNAQKIINQYFKKKEV